MFLLHTSLECKSKHRCLDYPALVENAATHWFQLPKTSIFESVTFFESDAKCIQGFFPLAKHGAPRAIENQHQKIYIRIFRNKCSKGESSHPRISLFQVQVEPVCSMYDKFRWTFNFKFKVSCDVFKNKNECQLKKKYLKCQLYFGYTVLSRNNILINSNTILICTKKEKKKKTNYQLSVKFLQSRMFLQMLEMIG